MMKKNLLTGCLAFLLALALAVSALAGLIFGLGTTPRIMLHLMERYAPPADTGLEPLAYGPVVRMITDYLQGKTDEFQYTFTYPDGIQIRCFNDREQAHMADCQSLFLLCRSILIAALITTALAALLLFLLKAGRQSLSRGMAGGFGLILILLIILLVWGTVDFNSLFLQFHYLSFSNQLWLMDPRQDLIIRLMPYRFFTAYAALIALPWLFLLILAEAAVILARKKSEHHDL